MYALLISCATILTLMISWRSTRLELHNLRGTDLETDGDTSTATNGHRSGFFRFFSNPWVGIIGSVASIVSVPLALIFYFESVSQPDLVYYTNPVRTIVVKQGTASHLTVSFDGHPLTQDVTAVQIAIWNRGRQAIRKEAVLHPLVIKTNPKVPILEAIIQRRSRDVVELTVDQSSIAQGEVSISWNILEQSDGGVVQLVYASSPDVQIQCETVIVGQPAIRELKYGGTLKSPGEQLREEKGFRYVIIGMSLMNLFMVILVVWSRRRVGGIPPPYYIFTIILTVLGIVTFVWGFFLRAIPSPPFGFQ